MTKIIRKRNKLGQFTKAHPWDNIAFIKKTTSVLLMTLMLFGFLDIKETNSYYNDTETSSGNSFSAAMLDFRLTKNSFSGFIGKEYKGEKDTATIAVPVTGSLGMQYKVSTTSASPICDQFTLKAERNEVLVYSGPVSDFNVSTSTEFGTFGFEFDLPVGASITQGDLCQADFVFEAWREDIIDSEQSGYFDVETFSVNLNAKTIVLNEVLANPDSSYPYPANKEYIELKNNGNMPVDVAGWKVSELTSGGVENKYNITTTSDSYTAIPYGGTTIIPAGGWIVLLLSDGTALDNTGDTIRLYDNNLNKLDEYSYTTTKHGMSDARYLDGVGDWVDPVPTPGTSNELSGVIVQEETIIPEEPIVPKEISPASPDIIAEIPPVIEPASPDTSQGGPEETIVEKSLVVEEAPIGQVLPLVVEPASPDASQGGPAVEETIITVEESVITTPEVVVEPQPSLEATAGEAELVIEVEPASPDTSQGGPAVNE